MTSSLADIRDALATALGEIGSLNILRHAPEQPPVPCLFMLRTAGSPRTDFGRTTPSYDFSLRLVVSRADAASAQEQLDTYVERGTDESIWDALEADVTLGGVVQTLRCGDVSGDQLITFGDVAYLGADFAVTVYPA